MNGTQKFILTGFAVFALLMALIILRDSPVIYTEPEVVVNGDIGYESPENSNVKLKATNGLVFNADSDYQEVDFVNENDDYGLKAVGILGNGVELFSSGLILPGETCCELNLAHSLEAGTYHNCILVYKIYSLNENNFITQCEFPIEIKVINKGEKA